MSVKEMAYEPLAFMGGSFRGSQLKRPTVDKEGLAILNTFYRLDYFL